MADVAARMVVRLDELKKGFFSNNDTGVDACPAGVVPKGVPCACWMARHKYGGNLGPYQEVTV